MRYHDNNMRYLTFCNVYNDMLNFIASLMVSQVDFSSFFKFINEDVGKTIKLTKRQSALPMTMLRPIYNGQMITWSYNWYGGKIRE